MMMLEVTNEIIIPNSEIELTAIREYDHQPYQFLRFVKNTSEHAADNKQY